MRLILLSGRSGSGKSTALGVLEDSNFYCIDNLPVLLLPSMTACILSQGEGRPVQVAVSIDARNLPGQLERFPAILNELRSQGIDCTVFYLDAEDGALQRRFSETRRRHPLSTETRSLAEAIADETLLLAPIAERADLRIDTTRLNPYQLRDLLKLRLLGKQHQGTAFLLESFGFKRGQPEGADLMFDARCLPNPYWHAELRDYNGRDEAVMNYLQAQTQAVAMYQDILAYLSKWLPKLAQSGRAYVTVSIGCTGGRHRSVWLVEKLARALKQQLADNVQIRHRDLD